LCQKYILNEPVSFAWFGLRTITLRKCFCASFDGTMISRTADHRIVVVPNTTLYCPFPLTAPGSTSMRSLVSTMNARLS
jgi:hypothetical protein